MPLPTELEPLMFFALDHGIESVRASGGPLTPFLLQARGSSVEITRLVADTLEEGLEHGRTAARASAPDVTAVALVYDGYLTVDDERCDAIMATVQAAGADAADIFAQRYRTVDGELTEVGNAKHIAMDQPSLLG